MNRYVFSYTGQGLRPTVAELIGRVATLVETLAERGVDVQLGRLAVEKRDPALVVLADILGPVDWVERAEPLLANQRIHCVPCR
ncbi:hypothetical protein [Pseudoxanthomonas composti]|uniref:Uncharacterized protein n=1 Tax=Pseudoxanthomonas composti TaxID=2137479 RepID=A0A4Q1JZ86_9GAMM|nr:hypothetical protein [Pseudoxanthomonas composti]RXR08640.1 hypothetical protein EPA99_02120 [Pseudoxanthomonas composti]